MVTTDENGILQDLERERTMTARQALLKRLWKLRVQRAEPDTHPKPAKGHSAEMVTSPHVRKAPLPADVNLDLGTAD